MSKEVTEKSVAKEKISKINAKRWSFDMNLIERIETLSETINDSSDDLRSYIMLYQELHRENNGLCQKIRTLEEELEKRETAFSQLKRINADLQNDVQRYKKQKEDFEEKLRNVRDFCLKACA